MPRRFAAVAAFLAVSVTATPLTALFLAGVVLLVAVSIQLGGARA